LKVFDDEDFERLESVCKRLYNDKPLTGDERRDLANLLQIILWEAIDFDELPNN
jgi:hypothetical protein